MRALFNSFVSVSHDILRTWVLDDINIDVDVECEAMGAKGIEEGRLKGDLVMMDCITAFKVKGLQGDAIRVPRMLSFLVGQAEEDMGTGGLWILEAKVWWNSGVLGKEIENRKGRVEGGC